MTGYIHKRRPPIERFMEKIETDPNGCWLWTASLTTFGYGQFNRGDRSMKAHRWSYLHFVGPIPDGLELDHICRVRRCVNPEHLRAVTHKENQENRASIRDGRLGIRGTSFNKRLGKWQAYVRHHDEQKHLGFYETREEAATVAREARNRLFTHNNEDR